MCNKVYLASLKPAEKWYYRTVDFSFIIPEEKSNMKIFTVKCIMNKNVDWIKSKWNMTKNYFTAGRNWMKLSEILLIITLMVSLYKAPQKYTLVIYICSLIWFLPQQENKDPILLKKLYKVLMIWFTINSHMWKLMCFHP